MERRTAISAIGVGVVGLFAGGGRPSDSSKTARRRLPLLHPIAVARVVGTVQINYMKQHRRYLGWPDVITSNAGDPFRGHPFVASIRAGGSPKDLGLETSFTLSDDAGGYSFTIGELGEPTKYFLDRERVIYKGRREKSTVSGDYQFIGRPMDHADVEPNSGLFRRFGLRFGAMVPTLYAGPLYAHTQCCGNQDPPICVGAYHTCTDCGDPDNQCPTPQTCCFVGFKDCMGCCANSTAICPCLWGLSGCTGA